MSELNKIALKILSNGKGILAADESNGTMTKRLESVSIQSSPENRLLFRETLFTAESMRDCIGGVILYDETINQKSNDGKTIPSIISETGAVPGIKVDTGAKDLANSPDEKVTEGLDGLRERLEEYSCLGAKFAKWRAVIAISDNLPSPLCIDTNSHALARYSALCQEAGIVPIVEPEVLMDGSHSIERCYEVTKKTLTKVFDELVKHKVNLKGICLKPNMIIDGKESTKKSSPEEIANMTVNCFKETVPSEVPGIVFLSGGQSEVEATENLNAINQIEGTPWNLSFSYGRALQASALQAWQGLQENEEECSKAFSHRAKMNSLATKGMWTKDQEN